MFDVLPLTYQYNSLAKLRTHYIDILYVHWWDWKTSMKEVMNGLHNLVVAGKVLYLVRVITFQMVADTGFDYSAIIGNFRLSSVGGLASKSICGRSRQVALRHLSRGVERHGPCFRA